MSALTLDTITKSFGPTPVLRGISLSVDEGELFFVLGPSGCGKSTLLRIIAGLERADSGHITLNGNEISKIPPHKRGFAMVFQSYALWPHMTVSRNVGFGLECSQLSRAARAHRVREMLELVQMASFGDRYPHELSGGQQQRVALARALAIRPSLLLLDEPLSNLDPRLREEIRGEIKLLQQKLGMTMIYVTHDQEDALTLASRVALLHEGRVLQIGSPRELYEQPSTDFCAAFLGHTNLFPCELLEKQSNERGVFRLNELPTAPAVGALIRAADAASGHPIALSVRPEVIRISTNSAHGIAATVANITYRGGFIDLQLNTAAAGTPSARLDVRLVSAQLPLREFPLAIGTQLFASWSPEHASIVARL
jgi:ABC-type Fe3+/spermidine/putrescine transport system ATPase subunit